MTGQRSGTIALIVVCLVYAALLGGWYVATAPHTTPPATATAEPTATVVPPTYTPVPPGWQELIPTTAAAPTPALLRPPFTLAPELTPTF